LWDKYSEEEIIVNQLLKKCGKIYGFLCFPVDPVVPAFNVIVCPHRLAVNRP
jgi:hypothetical protein